MTRGVCRAGIFDDHLDVSDCGRVAGFHGQNRRHRTFPTRDPPISGSAIVVTCAGI